MGEAEQYCEQRGRLQPGNRLSCQARIQGDVRIAGERYYSEWKVRDQLGLQSGDPVDDQVLAVKSREVVRAYREDYYPDVAVKWRIDPADPGRGLARVILEVFEGGRARVRGARVK